MRRSTLPGFLLVLALIAGSQTVLGKFALESMPVFGYTGFRFAVAFLIICIALRATGRKLPWKKIRPFAPVAILWILSAVAFIFGLQRTGATTTQFIHTAIPIITAIFAGLILRHTLTRVQWLGVAIAFVGVSMVILSNGSLSLTNANFLGSILVFSSAIGFALYAVLTKLPRFRGIDPFEMIFIGFIFGLPMVMPFSIYEFLDGGNWLPAVNTSAWLALMSASLAMVIVAAGLQMLINKTGPSYASMSQYLIPLFVIFWAAIILKESPELQSLIGCAIALAGVGLVTWSQRKEDIETAARATGSAE